MLTRHQSLPAFAGRGFGAGLFPRPRGQAGPGARAGPHLSISSTCPVCSLRAEQRDSHVPPEATTPSSPDTTNHTGRVLVQIS